MKITKTQLRQIIREELLNEKYDFPKMTKDMKNIRKDIVNLTKMAQKNGIPDDQIYSQLVDTGEWIKQWSKQFHGKMKQEINKMKITKTQLRKLIREEIQKLNERNRYECEDCGEIYEKGEFKNWTCPECGGDVDIEH